MEHIKRDISIAREELVKLLKIYHHKRDEGRRESDKALEQLRKTNKDIPEVLTTDLIDHLSNAGRVALMLEKVMVLMDGGTVESDVLIIDESIRTWYLITGLSDENEEREITNSLTGIGLSQREPVMARNIVPIIKGSKLERKVYRYACELLISIGMVIDVVDDGISLNEECISIGSKIHNPDELDKIGSNRHVVLSIAEAADDMSEE